MRVLTIRKQLQKAILILKSVGKIVVVTHVEGQTIFTTLFNIKMLFFTTSRRLQLWEIKKKLELKHFY